MNGMEKFKKFQKDLWLKKFHPHPKDLLAKLPQDISPKLRKTYLKKMSLKIEYHSDASIEDSEEESQTN